MKLIKTIHPVDNLRRALFVRRELKNLGGASYDQMPRVQPLIGTSNLAFGLDPVLMSITIEEATLFVELNRPAWRSVR